MVQCERWTSHRQLQCMYEWGCLKTTHGPALEMWGCSFSLAPPLTHHCNWPLPTCGSEPAFSSLLPQPSPHPTCLLHHLLSGGSVTHVSLPIPTTLTTLKQSSQHLTSLLQNPPWLPKYTREVSTNTRTTLTFMSKLPCVSSWLQQIWSLCHIQTCTMPSPEVLLQPSLASGRL